MDDCGVMFEVYHAFSNKEEIKNQLKQYEEKVEKEITNSPPIYDFSEYNCLVKKVKEIFPNRKSIKGDAFYFIKNIFLFTLFLTLYYPAIFMSGLNIYLRSILAFISGFVWMIVAFNIMHDGSHYAISTNPKINQLLESIWNSFSLWDSYMWLLHHVYAHHSFTGHSKFDPDTQIPQAEKYNNKGILGAIRKCSENIFLFSCMIIPGLFTGTTLIYYYGVFVSGNIWGLKVKNYISHMRLHEVIIKALAIYCLWKGWFFPSLCYLTGCNIMNHLAVTTNHDTFESAVANKDDNTDDWAKIQICHSANHGNKNPWSLHLFGGLNYQIEHHLFPNMCHVHYPKVKQIVKEFSRKKGYSYADHETFIDSYKSFLKNMEFQNQGKIN
jgi:linoleoyl-CoA desaturase